MNLNIIDWLASIKSNHVDKLKKNTPKTENILDPKVVYFGGGF